MGRRQRKKPYRIIGAYDSETTNIVNSREIYAYPVTHQLGLIDCRIDEITPENVEDATRIYLYRHALDLYGKLDEIAQSECDYVPIIVCHNLAFDMYGLAPWLSEHEVKVLAKSQRKPINFTILDDVGKPALMLWDTLVFSGQSLARMGEDAGYLKEVGKWDYDLIRTPETPLTDDERDYAVSDIYTLLVWLSWWISNNPDIEAEKLGCHVMTKTGVVRERRKVRFANAKHGRYNVGRQWYFINRQQAPKSDDELFTMQAATRGGFTFCASAFASIPFDLRGTGDIIAAYDATSQHPAQMVSHRMPVHFTKTSGEILGLAFKLVSMQTPNDVLRKWSKPFSKAFYGAFRVTNIRPKKGSLFERFGILPLASARFHDKANTEIDEDNGDSNSQDDNRRKYGYADTAENAVFAFGKLVRADSCIIYLTELGAWEVSQAYDYDKIEGLHGYITGRFTRPSDMAVISVMQFYQAKNEFKKARGEYLRGFSVSNGDKLRELGFSPALVSDLENGLLSRNDLEAAYLSTKANLNSLFGIEASNEYRRDTVLTASGIEYTGEMGICNAPKNPKTWYQYGQRIVGWSRIAQICAMYLIEPHVKGIINGDTDSLKALCEESKLPDIEHALSRLGRAIDAGKADNCLRVKGNYATLYDPLNHIGHYVLEFTAKRFCAAWNKAYCEADDNGEMEFTLAGVPTRDVYRKDGDMLKLAMMRLDGFAGKMLASGMKFGDVTDLLLGYNVTYSHDLTGLNARKFPEWGEIITKHVTDYRGREALVTEPAALALYPMAKTIGSTAFKDNRANLAYAVKNRSSVNTTPAIVSKNGITRLGND